MPSLSWDSLLSSKRTRELLGGRPSSKALGESRTEYERDRDRIISSTPFRRLSGKTQVFPLDRNDLVRTRLTHSLEVAAVAEGLASQAARDVISPCVEGFRADQLSAISQSLFTILRRDMAREPAKR